MKIIRRLHNLNKIPKGTVSAIGIFDGIHKGHLAIFHKVIKEAKRDGKPSLIITFHPHPLKIIREQHTFPLLLSLEHRLLIIRNLGIDYCLVIPFDEDFSLISPFLFVKNILYEGLGISTLYVGENFRFGYKQKGNINLLRKLSAKFNFQLKVVPSVKYKKRTISSSWIRRELNRGNLKLVSYLLGRPFSIYGRVIKGEGIGKKLGFPTANLDIKQETIPPSGVYLVKVHLKESIYSGLVYIGNRPTFGEKKNLNVEVYILDFKDNLYGKFLEVDFIKRIRAEKEFVSSSSLISAIKKDVLFARRFFSRKPAF
ncbi:MAG: bifunctional riboflavin kinase/FAD synthetase [Candidatus Omnitrophota bacterium]